MDSLSFPVLELELVDFCMHLFFSNISVASGIDCMRWKLNHNGKFMVFSYNEASKGSKKFPRKSIWC